MKVLDVWVCVYDHELRAWLDSHGLEAVTFSPFRSPTGSGWMETTLAIPTALVPALCSAWAEDLNEARYLESCVKDQPPLARG